MLFSVIFPFQSQTTTNPNFNTKAALSWLFQEDIGALVK